MCFHGCCIPVANVFPCLGIGEVIADRFYASAFASGRVAQNQDSAALSDRRYALLVSGNSLFMVVNKCLTIEATAKLF